MADSRDEFRALLANAAGAPPPEQLEEFFGLFRERQLARGEHYLRAGDRARTFELVSDGVLRLYYIRADGREFTKGFLRRGNYHAAIDSVVAQLPTRYSVQAVTAVRLLVADYARFSALFDRDMYWQRLARHCYEHLALKKYRREAALLMDSATDRYEAFLNEHSGIESAVPDHMIASYLGITAEALSRIKRARLSGNNRR